MRLILGVFGDLIQLSLDGSGLMYHCSQYGVTLIIPDGAVQHPTTIWFGACLYSDKFKFGDYVPITPIVWIFIDRPLEKFAQLYIPHNIADLRDVGQFTVLTADDDCSSTINFHQSKFQMIYGSNFFQIKCSHFCSNCVGTPQKEYKLIPKLYLLAKAEKADKRRKLKYIQFIFLYHQKGCKKV